MKFLTLATLICTFNLFAKDYVLETTRVQALATALTSEAVMSLVSDEDQTLCGVDFIEADDGGSEPLYKLTVCNRDDVNCFALEFDTDDVENSIAVNITSCSL